MTYLFSYMPLRNWVVSVSWTDSLPERTFTRMCWRSTPSRAAATPVGDTHFEQLATATCSQTHRSSRRGSFFSNSQARRADYDTNKELLSLLCRNTASSESIRLLSHQEQSQFNLNALKQRDHRRNRRVRRLSQTAQVTIRILTTAVKSNQRAATA